ncbi:hypothetical protein BDV12DRAFT_197667 [Aspergillus spectabilis]
MSAAFISTRTCSAVHLQASEAPPLSELSEKGDEKLNIRSLGSMQWEGQTLDESLESPAHFHVIQLNSNEEHAHQRSDGAASSLSDGEGETLVDHVFDDIKGLFRQANEDSNDPTRVKIFLKSFYAVSNLPKQRPALKNFIRQTLSGNEPAFRRAWSAFLFMGRSFHAAVVLVQLASKVSSFSNVSFVHVLHGDHGRFSARGTYKMVFSTVGTTFRDTKRS